MTAALLPLFVVSLAAVAWRSAAPAPFQKAAESEHPEVSWAAGCPTPASPRGACQ